MTTIPTRMIQATAAALLAVAGASAVSADSNTIQLPKTTVSTTVLTTCPDPAPFIEYSKGAADGDSNFQLIDLVGTVKNVGGGTFIPVNHPLERAQLYWHWGDDVATTTKLQLQTMPGGATLKLKLQISPWSYKDDVESHGSVPTFTMIAVVWTRRDGAVRIVTVRRARNAEEQRYRAIFG